MQLNTCEDNEELETKAATPTRRQDPMVSDTKRENKKKQTQKPVVLTI